MKQYIWQRQDWPHFTWDKAELIEVLAQARKLQGQIIAYVDLLGLEDQAQVLLEEAFTTSAIEGEKLDRNSLRSSIANRLGLSKAGLSSSTRAADGLIELLLDATSNYQKSLTVERIHGWHAGLFPTGHSGIHKINVGEFRTSHEPMQVVSGSLDHTKIHFEAPPSKQVPQEVKSFLKWWSHSQKEDGLIRAGIAHLWFVTIHPYDDGNGRLARAITDMALAQDEKTGYRLYSVSAQILKERDAYYEILESIQKNNLDITLWLKWFLEMLTKAFANSQGLIHKAIFVAKFWKHHQATVLNERQRKVIQKMLALEPEGFLGGITNKKYVSITKTSRESAKRDLADLEQKGILKRNPGEGRSVSYSLSLKA